VSKRRHLTSAYMHRFRSHRSALMQSARARMHVARKKSATGAPPPPPPKQNRTSSAAACGMLRERSAPSSCVWLCCWAWIQRARRKWLCANFFFKGQKGWMDGGARVYCLWPSVTAQLRGDKCFDMGLFACIYISKKAACRASLFFSPMNHKGHSLARRPLYMSPLRGLNHPIALLEIVFRLSRSLNRSPSTFSLSVYEPGFGQKCMRPRRWLQCTTRVHEGGCRDVITNVTFYLLSLAARTH
jgi:hypothetical protein